PPYGVAYRLPLRPAPRATPRTLPGLPVGARPDQVARRRGVRGGGGQRPRRARRRRREARRGGLGGRRRGQLPLVRLARAGLRAGRVAKSVPAAPSRFPATGRVARTGSRSPGDLTSARPPSRVSPSPAPTRRP